jgi:hypothetical protein
MSAYLFYSNYYQHPTYIPSNGHVPTGEYQQVPDHQGQAVAMPPRINKQYEMPDNTRDYPRHPQPVANITIEGDTDPYSDAIKRQDLYTMYDPLTYPQLRLPREVLERYNEYYERTGSYPPFNAATQPQLFDNPILNGILMKEIDPHEPFDDKVPSTIPLFRVRSSKNTNRYFYYILDQRFLSKIELKIPLDTVKLNGVAYNNADFYGLPEIFDGDSVENISIYPATKFNVTLYKTYHFP